MLRENSPSSPLPFLITPFFLQPLLLEGSEKDMSGEFQLIYVISQFCKSLFGFKYKYIEKYMVVIILFVRRLMSNT